MGKQTIICSECKEPFTYYRDGGRPRNTCDEHIKTRHNRINRESNARRKAAGSCPKCGGDGPFETIEVTGRSCTYCRDCNAENAENQASFRLNWPDLAAERSAKSSKEYSKKYPDRHLRARQIWFDKSFPTQEAKRAEWRRQWHAGKSTRERLAKKRGK